MRGGAAIGSAPGLARGLMRGAWLFLDGALDQAVNPRRRGLCTSPNDADRLRKGKGDVLLSSAQLEVASVESRRRIPDPQPNMAAEASPGMPRGITCYCGCLAGDERLQKQECPKSAGREQESEHGN